MATYYVSPTGNDSTGDGSIGNPWQTFSKFNVNLVAGDTGYVRAGTYTASASRVINPSHSGTAANHIRYSAYPGETVIIDGNNKAWLWGIGFETGQDYIDIVNFTIQDFAYNICYIGAGSSYILIEGCTFLDSAGFPIELKPAASATPLPDHVTIRNCTIITASGNQAAIRLGGGTGHVVEGCTITCYDTDGIISLGDSNTIIGNTITCASTIGPNHDDGIVFTAPNAVIANNIISSFTQGIYMALLDGSPMTLSNTYIYGNILYNQNYWDETTGEAPGIFFDEGVNTDIAGMYIFNNTFLWNGYANLIISCNAGGSTATDIVIMNNVFTDGGISINVDTPSEVTSDYNIFWESGTQPDSPQQQSPPWSSEGAHSLNNTDPDFLSYNATTHQWNCHLTAGSPAIGAGAGSTVLGTYFTVPSLWTDMGGVSRTGDTIGAYEYAGSLAASVAATATVTAGMTEKEALSASVSGRGTPSAGMAKKHGLAGSI